MNDDIHALSGAYAVDAVDEFEAREFQRHLEACAECQAEVASFRATSLQLSLLLESTPPARMREQVLRDIALVRPIPPEVSREAAARIERRGRLSSPAAVGASDDTSDLSTVTPIGSRAARRATAGQRVNRWLATAAAVAVLGGGTVAVLHPWDRQTQVQVGLADRVIQAPDAQRFQQTVASGGTATMVRSKSVGKAVLVTENLSAAPTGKVYQLWLQAAGGNFVSAGLLPQGADQTVVLDGDAATALGAGISVEPPGGSQQPTTTPVALMSFA